MTTLRVQADDLDAAANFAEGQREQLSQMDQYTSEHLSRLGAFGGVLMLFRSQYAQALESVHAGLQAEGARSGGMTDGFRTCRREFTEADQRSQEMLGRVTASIRQAAEGKLEAEVNTLRAQGGPWQRVVEARDAIGGLTSAANDVQDGIDELAAEVEELGDTADDLRRYDEFISEPPR